MSWVAVAVGAGSIVTGYLGSQSASKASGAAQKGADQAIAEQRRQIDQVRSDTAGQRFIGNGATDLLSRLYGYGAPPRAGIGGVGASASPYQAPAVNTTNVPGGSLNIGGTLAASGKYGGIGKLLDPVGSLFGNKHGDEKRNLKAFTAENQIYDLGNGMLSLADGTQFKKSQLQDVAGAWYGANYAPDGNQGEWQQKYSGLVTAPPAPATPSASGTGAAAPAAGKPDMSAFFESPDYQFNLGEGQKAIDRSLAARGGALSGGGVREGVRYASGMASREFGGFVDRLMQQAGLGATGIGASAAAGANAAGNIGNAYMNAGNAKAGAYMQQGQAINNAVQGGTQNFLLYKYLNG